MKKKHFLSRSLLSCLMNYFFSLSGGGKVLLKALAVPAVMILSLIGRHNCNQKTVPDDIKKGTGS